MLKQLVRATILTIAVAAMIGCDDNDCNTRTYFADVDGDGLGNPATAQAFCEGRQPDGLVLNNDDPDDDDPTNGVRPPLEVTLDIGEMEQLDGPGFTLFAYNTVISETYQSEFSAYVIEGESSVFVFDVGVNPAFGEELKRITDAIGKPIERIIISHAHPDHVGGLGSFPDVPVYAVEGVAATLAVGIPAFGVAAIPGINVLPMGEQTIEGITMTVSSVLNTEAPENVIIDLGEEASMVFVNDIMMREEHLFIGNGTVENWLVEIANIGENFGDYEFALTGHGGIANTAELVASNTDYLTRVLTYFAESATPAEMAARLIADHPTYPTQGIFNFSLNFFWSIRLNIPDVVTLPDESYMEGLAIDGTANVYTSNFATGEINLTNYKLNTNSVFASADANNMTGWGLAIDQTNRTLFALKNGPVAEFQAFFANPFVNGIQTIGKLEAYDLDTGEMTGSWDLPVGAAGNAVTTDNAGNAYITDIAGARLLKYDATTDTLGEWVQTPFGFLGGVVFDGQNSLYVHGGDSTAILNIAINDDGSAAEPTRIELSGVPLTNGDGLVYYNENTLFSTVDFNSVVRINLNSDGTASVETVIAPETGFFPTSLAIVSTLADFLFINDGQLDSVLFGAPARQPTEIRVMPVMNTTAPVVMNISSVNPGMRKQFDAASADYNDMLSTQQDFVAHQGYYTVLSEPANVQESFVNLSVWQETDDYVAAVANLSGTPEAAALNGTRSVNFNAMLRQLEGPSLDLTTLATGSQVMEAVVRTPTGSSAELNSLRQAYINALMQEPGVVASYEFTVLGDNPNNHTVGVIVYENSASHQAIINGLNNMPVAQAYFNAFNVVMSQAANAHTPMDLATNGINVEPVMYPEDVLQIGNYVYVSNVVNGAVTRFSLEDPSSSEVFVPAAQDQFIASWGLAHDTVANRLVMIANQNYDFNPANALAGRVKAFDLDTGTMVGMWELPAATVGNSVAVDANGDYFVSDIGPNARIIRIDTSTNLVTEWARDSQWVDGGIGFGGMVFVEGEQGFYASHNSLLWFIPQNEDGTAATAQIVSVANSQGVFADGLAYAGNGVIYYSQNDLFIPGSNGVLNKIVLTDTLVGEQTAIQTGLTDAAGVEVGMYNGEQFLYVLESQLGFLFQVDEGEPGPFELTIFQQ